MRRSAAAICAVLLAVVVLPVTAQADPVPTRPDGWGVGLDYDLDAVRRAQARAVEEVGPPPADLVEYFADRPVFEFHPQNEAAEQLDEQRQVHITEDQLPEMQERMREYLSLRYRSMSAAAAAVGQPLTLKIPTVLLKTNNEDFQPGTTADAFEQQLSGIGTTPTGTITEMYLEQSYGNMVVDFDVYGPYEVSASNTPATDCFYGNSGWSDPLAPPLNLPGGLGVKGMSREVVPQSTVDIDYGQYDNDLDGIVDFLLIVHSGKDASGTADPCDIWSHYWGPLATANTPAGTKPLDAIPTEDLNAENEPVVVAAAMTVPEIDLGIGVVAHEFMHALGEPDYYDTASNNLPREEGSGDWDLGAGGSWLGTPTQSNPIHFNPVMKINMGWVEPTRVDATVRDLELRPRGMNPDLVMVPIRVAPPGSSLHAQCNKSAVGVPSQNIAFYDDANNCLVEGFLLENLSPSAALSDHDGCLFHPADFDRQAYGSGLAIWHWDMTTYAQGGNNNSSRLMLDLEEFDRRDTQQELQYGITRAEPTDLFWGDPVGISNATQLSGPNVAAVQRGPAGTRGNDGQSPFDPAKPGARAQNGWSFTNIRPHDYTGVASAVEAPGATITLDLVKHDDTTVDVSGDFLRPVWESTAVANPAVLAPAEPIVGGEPLTLVTPVYEHGGAPVTATVALYDADPASGAAPLATRTVDLDGYGRDEVAFEVTPAAGLNEYFVVTSADGDLVAGNDIVRTELVASDAGPADVLVVDNDRGWTQEEDVVAALRGLGVRHHVVDGEPSADVLARYPAVIWLTTTVSGGPGVLSPAGQQALTSYLDGGGDVWFTSTRAPAYVPAAVMEDYFGLVTDNNLSNSWGTAIAQRDRTIGWDRRVELGYLDGRAYLQYNDLADPAAVPGVATALFTHSQRLGKVIATRVEGDAGFRSVYSFPVSLIEDARERTTLVREVLDWFGVPQGQTQPTGTSVAYRRFRHVQPGQEWPVTVGAVSDQPIDAVELAYRTYGDDTWKAVTLTGVGGGLYGGTIPAADVTNNGLEYFARVTLSSGETVVGGGGPDLPDVASAGYGPASPVDFGACAAADDGGSTGGDTTGGDTTGGDTTDGDDGKDKKDKDKADKKADKDKDRSAAGARAEPVDGSPAAATVGGTWSAVALALALLVLVIGSPLRPARARRRTSTPDRGHEREVGDRDR